MLTLPWLASESSPDRRLLAAWRTRGVSTRVTAPQVEPIDLPTAKAQSGITLDANDALTEFRLRAAREWVERYTGRGCMRQTWDWTLIDSDIPHGGPILLPVAPVLSIVSVTSYNAAGTGTVMSNTLYFLDEVSSPARLLLTEGAAWPSGLRTHNALVVRYLAGYGRHATDPLLDGTDPEQVPAPLRQAILLLAAEWNERREAATDRETTEVSFGIRALLDPYCVWA